MRVTTHTNRPDPFDVIVIGAGQAGLAVGHELAAHGATFVILDAAPEVGSAWRNRWDSLRLFSPAQYDSLPGMPFPAPADTHPTKDDVADYLADYAAHFALPVRLSTPVRRLHRDHDGTYLVTTPTGLFRARQVVVATGPFQRPLIPTSAADLAPHVTQLHSADYRSPRQLSGRVLVVGGGNSGLQIAAELADTCSVTVAGGSRPVELPQRVAGRDLFFWLTKSGFFTLRSNSRLARRLQSRGDLVIGTRTSTLRRKGIDFRPRLVGFDSDQARFADGATLEVDAVVWATGFRSDYSWLHLPGVITEGQVRHREGVTDSPGLFFIGLPWQTSRGSALLGFVGHDAVTLVKQMAFVPNRQGTQSSVPLSLS